MATGSWWRRRSWIPGGFGAPVTGLRAGWSWERPGGIGAGRYREHGHSKRAPARRALAVPRRFSDDTLDYFTERLSTEPTREAVHSVLRRAKRNKAFQDSAWIGLAVDGTASGRSAEPHCPLCRPQINAQQEVVGYDHR